MPIESNKLLAIMRSCLNNSEAQSRESLDALRATANDTADELSVINERALTDLGFGRDGGNRWFPPATWQDANENRPNPNVPIWLFRQAYGVGNPLHPGFGTDAWIEETFLTTHPWDDYACNLVSTGAPTHWIYRPSPVAAPIEHPKWQAIDLLGAKFGSLYCHWSDIMNCPVSSLMTRDLFRVYVMIESGHTDEAGAEMDAWLSYIDEHGTSDRALGDLLKSNRAGPGGTWLNLSQLLTQFSLK